MRNWERFVSPTRARWLIVGLGASYLVIAAALVAFLTQRTAELAEIAGRFALIAAPGLVLLYGGYRMSDKSLHPDAHPRVVAWTFRGIGVMALIVLVMEFISPSGVDNPSFALPLATALGGVGGFGAGVHDARARTRERELEETVEQLRTSNERLEQFAYAASHDLQEPLRMVSSYLQLIEDRYADELDEDAEEYIEFAVEGADRMRAMIKSLLEYSQVTAGDEPFEPTDVEAVFESVCDDLRLRIEETDATITTDDLPTIRAQPDQLAQVFRNLLTNALAYRGDEAPRVHVGAERTDGVWRFSVADEGIGIDPEYQDRIFAVFEQLHTDSDGTERGGGGVGLALCERIVEHHGVRPSSERPGSTGEQGESVGGDIWVESEPGAGTTVVFTIPDSEERPRPSADASPAGR